MQLRDQCEHNVAVGEAPAGIAAPPLRWPLQRQDMVDYTPEDAFDRITALAADIFDAPVSFIAILDHGRIRFKSHHGLSADEMVRCESWAAAIVAREQSRPIDVKANVRTLANPLGVGGVGPRFHVGVPLRRDNGDPLGTLCVLGRNPRRIDERQMRHLEALAAMVVDHLAARSNSARALDQAKLLARESDHRVTNSLQLVSSLLQMQVRTMRRSEAGTRLSLAAGRISAVARMHRCFAGDHTADRAAISSYLQQLCGELSNALDTSIAVESLETTLPTQHILALGLLVNELVANAAKHGTAPIAVTFSATEAGEFQLRVTDVGKGLPENFAPDCVGSGLGMRVTTALTQQLRGRLTAGANPSGAGACFSVTFPAG